MPPIKLPIGVTRLVTYRRARFIALVLVALYATAWAYEIVGGAYPLNAAGAPVVGDYIAFHAAGALVRSGLADLVYDRPTLQAVQAQLLNGRVAGFYDAFRNPPFFALVFVPLSALPLIWAFVLWAMVSIGCLAVSVWLLLPERWPGGALLVLAFAPVYFGLVDGENASLSLLLYVLFFRAFRRRAEVEAGVWAALGLFKPQLFLVFPFILLARRAWRGLVTYAMCASALALVSVAVVGPDGLVAWLRSLLDTEAANSSANAWRMASLASLFAQLLPGAPSVALSLYAVCAVALLAVVVWLWSADRASFASTWALTCLVAVLIDPHLVDYDLTVLVSAGAVLLSADARPLHRWLAVALYVSTLLRPELPIGDGGVLITPLVLILLLCVSVAQLVPTWPAPLRVLRRHQGAPSV